MGISRLLWVGATNNFERNENLPSSFDIDPNLSFRIDIFELYSTHLPIVNATTHRNSTGAIPGMWYAVFRLRRSSSTLGKSSRRSTAGSMTPGCPLPCCAPAAAVYGSRPKSVSGWPCDLLVSDEIKYIYVKKPKFIILVVQLRW